MIKIPFNLDHKVDRNRKLFRVIWLLFHFHVFLLSLSINRCYKLDFFEFILIEGPLLSPGRLLNILSSEILYLK